MGTVLRKYAFWEPLSVFVLIMAYIWDLRYSHAGFWIAILGLRVLSHRLHYPHGRILLRKDLRALPESLFSGPGPRHAWIPPLS